MPLVVAVPAIALLYLAILAPGALALARPRARLFAGGFYMLFFLALALHYFGAPWAGAPVTLARVQIGPAPRAPQQACADMIRQAEEGGVIRDRSATMFVLVDRQGWQAMPPDDRVALTACLDRARPDDVRAVPLQIVQD